MIVVAILNILGLWTISSFLSANDDGPKPHIVRAIFPGF